MYEDIPIENTVVIDQGPEVKHYISKACPMCGKRSRIQVSPIRLARWAEGDLVQEVWPTASNDIRELLMTGTHGSCWERMFPPEDEEE